MARAGFGSRRELESWIEPGRVSINGKLATLGVTTSRRADVMPDVPTLAEQGLKDFDISLWFGVWAPAGTPPAIVQKLKQIKVVATLTAAECVWRFDSGSTQVEDIEIINKNQVKVHTRESVKACLYCGGKADPASYDGDFRFVYVVEKVAGQWLVSSRILAETFRNERSQSTCPGSP